MKENNKISKPDREHMPVAGIWSTNINTDIRSRDEGIVWQDRDHSSKRKATEIVRRVFNSLRPSDAYMRRRTG